MDKTPTHAHFAQHYISLACWFQSACVGVLSIIE